MYIHTYIHLYIHTHIHIYAYIYIHSYICTISQTAIPVSLDMGKDAKTGIPVSRVERIKDVPF